MMEITNGGSKLPWGQISHWPFAKRPHLQGYLFIFLMDNIYHKKPLFGLFCFLN